MESLDTITLGAIIIFAVAGIRIIEKIVFDWLKVRKNGNSLKSASNLAIELRELKTQYKLKHQAESEKHVVISDTIKEIKQDVKDLRKENREDRILLIQKLDNLKVYINGYKERKTCLGDE
jgi:hypothetical protein